MMTTRNGEEKHPFLSIDKLVHEPARLFILAQLYVVESVDFIYLLQKSGMTQGNLSSHLNKLEAVKCISVTKEFVGKKPHTLLAITQIGKDALKNYITSMKKIVEELSNDMKTG
jgi:DNA-binding HxlR family transcriptional regulator